MSRSYHIAIAGATGAVGQELLRVMERRRFPAGKLTALASERSVGRTVEFRGEKVPVGLLRDDAFAGVDFAFFSAGATRSRQYAPAAVRAGAVVIDNSSAFRMDTSVPLVVPEVNAGDLAEHKGLIANPNCSAAILCVGIWPIHRAAGIRRVVVSTYQSASGAGARAMAELESQSRDVLEGRQAKPEAFPHQIAFNLFSHNTRIAENGYNEEENKMVEETRKMFHAPEMVVVPTCIRVPVFRAHSESVLLELERPMRPEEAREILESAPGVRLVDDASANRFPMPVEASGELDVLVGRIRQEPGNPRGLAMFISGDQLLKGAAWNAVQIAECLIGTARA
ncbi:MAG TPA: aspartate-semialdehyde dehydrogenase [Verrucomicrobiae bacterium]|nr:aspartate-semialdehyde dehydrogenase [Verrucomicrobiae bacterium]